MAPSTVIEVGGIPTAGHSSVSVNGSAGGDGQVRNPSSLAGVEAGVGLPGLDTVSSARVGHHELLARIGS